MEPFLPSEFYRSPDAKKPKAEDPNRERIDHFVLLKKLGEGGMGVVYAAWDERLARMVAIKTMRALKTDSEARKRLWREARAAAGISHPNICQVYDIQEAGDCPYLVMELMDGESLAEKIARGPIALRDSIQLTIGMLTGIGVLHSQGLVHRDLKPSNVFLTEHGVKLLDFGLARSVPDPSGWQTQDARPGGDQVTQEGILVGTPRYMAPEQIEAKPFDNRIDLFSVGAMLYEMLSGKPAFAGDSALEVYHAVLHQQPPALGGSQAIEAMNRIIFKTLSKKPEDRYETSETLSAELQSILLAPDAGSDVSATPISRLIVLPFRFLKPDSDFEYLTASLPETITSSLSQLESVQVRKTLSRKQVGEENPNLKVLAREASVDSVLTGTLLRAGDQIRLTAQLLQVPDGTVVWSSTSTSKTDDLFVLEETLCQKIIESFPGQDSGRGESSIKRDIPANAEAYEFYLRGTQQSHGPRHWFVARDLFRQSVDLDSNYAPAWARLARIQWLISKYTFDKSENHFELAEKALRRALSLSPDLPLAVTLRSNLDVYSGESLIALRNLLRRAQARKHDTEAYIGLVLACRFCGLVEASIAAHKVALQFDPSASTSVSYSYFLLADFERARAAGASELAGFGDELLFLSGKEEEARARVESRNWTVRDFLTRWVYMTKCMILGRRDEGVEIIKSFVEEFHDPEGFYHLARFAARWEEEELSFELFSRAVNSGYSPVQYLGKDPSFLKLSQRSDVTELLRAAAERRREAVNIFFAERGDEILGIGMK